MTFQTLLTFTKLSACAVIALGLSQPVMGSLREYSSPSESTESTEKGSQTGLHSLHLDRFQKFLSEVQTRVHLEQINGTTHTKTQFSFKINSDELVIAGTSSKSSTSPSLHNMKSIFDNYHQYRSNFIKSFFTRKNNELWTRLMQSQIDRYAEQGAYSKTKNNSTASNLNDRFSNTVENIETELNADYPTNPFELAEDFNPGDQDRLKHLDVLLRGDKAEKSSVTAVQTRKIEHIAFKSVLGDLLDSKASIVDEKFFKERPGQLKSLITDLKANFVSYMLDPTKYQTATLKIANDRIAVEDTLKQMGSGLLSQPIVISFSDILFVSSYMNLQLPVAAESEETAVVVTSQTDETEATNTDTATDETDAAE